MPRFTALLRETGFDPRTRFMLVSERRTGFVVLHEARGADLKFDRDRLDVRDVTRALLPQVSHALREQLLAWRLADADAARELLGALHNFVPFGGSRVRLLAVTGRRRGRTTLRAVHRGVEAALSVGVVPQLVVTVAFRFLQHLDAAGAMRPATRWTPDDARWLAAQLNRVYGPQANVTFDPVDADWAKVAQRLGDPLDSAAFRAHVVRHKHDAADLTVFFVGDRWTSDDGHAGGSYLYDEAVAVMTDDPQIPVVAGANPFLVTLAHEAAHHLRFQRGYTGHHDRPGVLLSSGLETTALDQQLVQDINPPS